MSAAKKILNKFGFILLFILSGLFIYKKIRTPEKAVALISENKEKECVIDADLKNTNSNLVNSDNSNITKQKILSKTDVEQIVKDYILNHPEEIIRSVKGLKEKKFDDFLSQNIEDIYNKNNPPVIGNKDGSITIVMFYDYACSYCKTAYYALEELISENSNVRVILRPVSIFGDGSLYASYVALLINENSKDKFQNFHERLLSEKNLTKKSIDQILDDDKIALSDTQKEMKDTQIMVLLNDNFEFADKLKVRGLPFYIIGKKIFTSALSVEELKDIIH